MFQNILTATDILTGPDARLKTAANIAEQNGARLRILHVLESASLDNRKLVKHFQTGEEILSNTEYEDTVKNEIEKNIAGLAGAVDCEIRVTTGFPWEEILRWGKDVRTDLIVLGPHSSRAEEKGVVRTAGKIGSTVEGVVTREDCPVMIVNDTIPKDKLMFERILVGVDFSNSCECALCFAVKLGQRYNSRITTFHMLPIPPFPKYSKKSYEADTEASKEKLEKFCHVFLDGMDHNYAIRGGALPHQEIMQAAEEQGADLIVLGSHTRARDGKWYAGSVVERVAYRSCQPVIVVTDPEVLLPWKNGLTEQLRGEKLSPGERLIHVSAGDE